MSPELAFGYRFNLLLMLQTLIMCKFFAPELSAQLMTAAVGRPADMRCLMPEAAARPRLTFSLMIETV